jgi:hypothetical protein
MLNFNVYGFFVYSFPHLILLNPVKWLNRGLQNKHNYKHTAKTRILRDRSLEILRHGHGYPLRPDVQDTAQAERAGLFWADGWEAGLDAGGPALPSLPAFGVGGA